jgi:antitoxin ParD1/3/4
MAIVRKTVSLLEKNNDYVKAKVASGEFATDSEVIRAALEQAEAIEAHNDGFYAEVQKGLDSGISDKTFDEIITLARAKAIKRRNASE